MSAIRQLFTLPWAHGYSYILETKEDFHEIGWLKVKLIRWLHLEWFFGIVYSTDIEGLGLLSEKVNHTYKGATLPLPPGYYEHIVSLSDTLHDIRKPLSSLSSILKLVNSVAVKIISSYLKAQTDSADKREFSRYGTLQAEKFLESHLLEKERCSFSALGAEECLNIYQDFPTHTKEVLGSFLAQIQKRESEQIAQSILAQYFVSRFQLFYNVDQKPSPSALAAWFKGTLQEISEQFENQARALEFKLIWAMKKTVQSENLKESLRAYGVFVAQGWDGIPESFEQAASSLKTLFSTDEIKFVMEGMIERKVVPYCQAVAQAMRSGDLSEQLPAYVDRIPLLFSSASNQVVQGVIRELVKQLSHQDIDVFCKKIVTIFEGIYQTKKDFSVFAPLLGANINVQKKVAPEAVTISLIDKRSRLSRADSECSLLSNVPKTIGPALTQVLLKIERKIVTDMMNQNSDFPDFYGTFLGEKIKKGAGDGEKWKEFYKNFIKKNFSEHADTMLKAMQQELEKQCGLSSSNPPAWE